MAVFDLEHAININLKILQILGLWPNEEHYTFGPYRIYFVVTFIVFAFTHDFCQITNLLLSLNHLESLTEAIFVTMCASVVMVKIYCITANITRLRRMLKVSRNDSLQPHTLEQEEIIAANFRFWRKIFIASVFQVILTSEYMILNPILNGTSKHSVFPITSWYPFETRHSPIYEIVYVHQFLSVSYLGLCTVNVNFLLVATMMFLSSQCEILCNQLALLGNHSENFSEELHAAIKRHREIIKFAKNTTHVWNLMIAGQFVTTAVATGVTLFQLTLVELFSTDFLSLSLYVSACLFEIFTLCWFGNEVTVKSAEIPLAIFETDWKTCSIETRKNLLFFLMKTQQPIEIRTFGLFDLSLETFKKILRTSWSYFAVLHRVHRK